MKQEGSTFEILEAGAVKKGIRRSPCPPKAQHKDVHGNKEGIAQNFVIVLENCA